MSNAEIVLNDPGTLVSDSPNTNLLPFPFEKQTANFELGVSMVIHGWHTLTTAVDNNWGGPHSAEKRDWISGLVVEEFEKNREIDIIYIHELLCGAMEDEFDVLMEDESTVEIGAKIVKCYKDCKEGNFENIQVMYQKWLNRQQNRTKIVANIVNDSSDDEDGDEDDDMDMDMDYEMVELNEAPRKNEPIVDEDGFTLVQNNRRR